MGEMGESIKYLLDQSERFRMSKGPECKKRRKGFGFSLALQLRKGGFCLMPEFSEPQEEMLFCHLLIRFLSCVLLLVASFPTQTFTNWLACFFTGIL